MLALQPPPSSFFSRIPPPPPTPHPPYPSPLSDVNSARYVWGPWHGNKQKITHGQNTMMLVLKSNHLGQLSKFRNSQSGRLFTCMLSGRGNLARNYNYARFKPNQESNKTNPDNKPLLKHAYIILTPLNTTFI